MTAAQRALIVVLVVGTINGLVPALHQLDRTAWALALVREDGWFEAFGALSCLLGGSCFLITAAALRRLTTAPAAPRIFPLVALGLLLLLMFGEEVSWGQRVLGFATPLWASKGNIQNEFNLHNLRFFHPALDFNWLKFAWSLAAVAYLGLFPFVVAWSRRSLAPGLVKGLPVAGGVVAVCMLASFVRYWTGTIAAHAARDGFGGHEIGEAFEATIEFLYLATAIETFLAYRSLGFELSVGRWRRTMGWVALLGALISVIGWWRTPGFDQESLAAVHYRRARWLIDQGRTAEACDAFREAAAAVPNAAVVHFDWANALMSQQRWAEAAEHFTVFTHLEPNSAEGFHRLGLARLALGERQAAIAAFERALALDGANAKYLADLDRARAQVPR